ncbi:MAG: hypothetical protein GAK29_03628 [Acinetobacter bereziniae]|uniref:Uncharacterized protein n=1 Tax=Acinetobacter bereziniae TaxID=106648 RepID=A0A833PCQ3_ACIBZ|nr:MAG: hypothetical protein GAK29_03628 [Acinetobacter bereziniae]
MTTINNLSIEQMREIVSKAPSNAESYQCGYYFRESPQFMFHNGFHDQWNLTDNDGLYFKAAGFHPVRIDDLRTAIAKHDTTDHVTDIRNHVSPSTLVWDLASGEDWTVEAERHG